MSRISIITPNLNGAEFLEATIESVISQGIRDLEYMIIDGGSTDKSVEIIKKYERHLTYWHSRPDQGQSEAINQGIQRATGQVINWLNSDDYYQPGALKAVSKHFEDSNVLVLCGRSRVFSGDQTLGFSRGTDLYPDNLAKTIGRARIDQPETFFRREAWTNTGLLNVGLHYTMDREWWIRYLLLHGLGGIKNSSEVLVNFRMHPSSKTATHQDKFQKEHDSIFCQLAGLASWPDAVESIEQHCQLVKNIPFNFPTADAGLLRSAVNQYLLQRGHEFYYDGKAAQARGMLNHVERIALDKNDRQLLQRLTFRNALIPSAFRFMLRRIGL